MRSPFHRPPPEPSNPRTVLRDANFRLYAIAQLAGGAGTWNQRIAELWLLLELTGDGLSLGLGAAFRTAPAIFLGAAAGALADRYDRRRLLIATQASRGVVGASFALITFVSVPDVAVVYGLVLALGIVGAFDGPIRRSFVRDVVEPDDLHSAASLHTATISLARMIGPIFAGVLIAVSGVSAAFAASALTAVVSVEAVRRIRTVEPPDADEAAADRRSGAEVGRRRRSEARIHEILLLLAVFTTLGWNLDVALPIVAEEVLGRGALTYSSLVICLSFGSFVGSVATGTMRWSRSGLPSLVVPLVAFGATMPLVAAGTSLVVIAVTLVLVGLTGGMFLSVAGAAIQTAADYESQGRVVALYTMIFTGCRAVGAPVLGWSVDAFGIRWAIAGFGAVTAAATVLVGAVLVTIRRSGRLGAPSG